MANQATPALLHRFLGIGLVTVMAVFFGLRARGIPEALVSAEASAAVAYIMCGLAALMAAVAMLVMRRRVPPRRLGQSEDDYWSRQEVVAAVLPIWFLMEGAGIVAAAGYLVTSDALAGVTAAIMVAGFWLSGPASFNRIT